MINMRSQCTLNCDLICKNHFSQNEIFFGLSLIFIFEVG